MSDFKCYEINRANIPQYGCTKQCDQCKEKEFGKILVNPLGREVDPMDSTQNHSQCIWVDKSNHEISLINMRCSCMRYEAGCFTANCRSCGLPPKEKITVTPRPPLLPNKEYKMFSLEEVTEIARVAFHFYKRNDLDDDELEEEFEKWLNNLKK